MWSHGHVIAWSCDAMIMWSHGHVITWPPKAKKCTKRVAVRALNFSTRPFCMKFRGGSNRDGPEGQNPQKRAKNIKNQKKQLRQTIGLKVKNRVDVKKKNGRVWVFPGTFLHHQILQIVQNFHTNPAVIGVNSRTPRKWPKWDLKFSKSW